MALDTAVHTVQQLTEILESVPTAVIVVDPAGTMVLVNIEAERLFGYSRDELLGEQVDMLLPERYQQGHPRLREGFMRDPAARPMGAGRDLFGRRRDGVEFPVEIGLNPLHTENGTFVVSVVVDISERKRLESRFRATVHSAPVAMVIIDARGRIQLVNAELTRLFDYTEAELLNQPVEILIPERVRKTHPGLRNQFLQAPRARRMGAGRDLAARRRDGSEFAVEIGLSPLETDEGTFVLAAIADISERKRLEALFRATVESAPVAMVMVDDQGLIQLVNAELARLFGYETGELLHQPIEILIPERYRGAHPGLRGGFFAAPEVRRMGGGGRDLAGMRRDGSEFPVEIGINPVVTPQGCWVLAAIIDLTERKRAADIALRRTNEALERSNIELQRFAYVASHDLQTPMRNVASFAELLRASYGDQLDEEGRDWIRRIISSVKQLQNLVRDLLDYARVDSQAHPFERIPAGELVAGACALLESSIEEAGAEVAWEELPTVLGDRAQLVQLLTNLIGNGLKYRGNRPPRIRVTARKEDQEWLFAVQDNGIGIAPHHQERIFEIFERLHSPQAYPGSGIGLAICRRVVHRHGGRIWVESQPDHGSTFFFTIPETGEEKSYE